MSTITVVTFPITSSASASLIRIPFSAPLPVPTMIDVGVASPSAHGQAIRSTATVFRSARTNAGSGPQTNHATKVTMPITITAGTK